MNRPVMTAIVAMTGQRDAHVGRRGVPGSV